MWTILVQNKRFEGIRPTPNPKPNPDGSYTVKLTTIQWKVFQDNQKKPAVPVPAEPESAEPAPGKEPEEKPTTTLGVEITVTQAPSKFRPPSKLLISKQNVPHLALPSLSMPFHTKTWFL